MSRVDLGVLVVIFFCFGLFFMGGWCECGPNEWGKWLASSPWVVLVEWRVFLVGVHSCFLAWMNFLW